MNNLWQRLFHWGQLTQRLYTSFLLWKHHKRLLQYTSCSLSISWVMSSKNYILFRVSCKKNVILFKDICYFFITLAVCGIYWFIRPVNNQKAKTVTHLFSKICFFFCLIVNLIRNFILLMQLLFFFLPAKWRKWQRDFLCLAITCDSTFRLLRYIPLWSTPNPYRHHVICMASNTIFE